MKHIRILLTAALVTVSIAASAQSSGIRLGLSGVNWFSAEIVGSFLPDKSSHTPYDLGSVYDELGDVFGYGSVSIGYVYESNTSDFSFIMDLEYSPYIRSINRKRTRARTGSFVCTETLSLSGMFCFSYVNRPNFNIYADAGPVLFISREMLLPLVSAQFNPFCISFGKDHLRFFLETGVGSMFIGVQAGVSYFFN